MVIYNHILRLRLGLKLFESLNKAKNCQFNKILKYENCHYLVPEI